MEIGRSICYSGTEDIFTNFPGPGPGLLRDERPWAILSGALAALLSIWLPETHCGADGILAQACALFFAAVALCRFSGLPLRTGLFLLAATMVQEAARPGTRLLLAVPAVLAGGAIGAWIRDREAGIAFPAITLALGAAAGLTLEQSPGAAALLLPASALVLTALRPVRVLLWCSLLAGATSVTGILLWLVSAHGPGEPGTVLPVRALIVTPMVFAGGVGGLLIARRYSFEDQENSYESS